METWKDVVGYEGLYQVSDMGNVKHLAYEFNIRHNCKIIFPEKIKEKLLTNNGYHRVHLSKNGKAKKISVHRLVATAFIPNPENLPQINHKRGVKTDNRATELEWCTQAQNAQHAGLIGLMPRGEKCNLSILTSDKVLAIRKSFDDGEKNISAIARLHFISISNAHNIIRRRTWKHL